MANAKMVVQIGEFRFEKYPSSNGVNVYIGDNEVHYFTNYNIGADFNKFEESCERQYQYLMENDSE